MKLFNVIFINLMLCIFASCHKSNFASFQSNSPEVFIAKNQHQILSKPKVETDKNQINEILDFSNLSVTPPIEISTKSQRESSKDGEKNFKKNERFLTHLESSKLLSKIAINDTLSRETKLLKRAKTSRTIGLIGIGLMLTTLITFLNPIAFFFLVFGLIASILSFIFGIGPLIKLPKGEKKMAAIGVLSSVLFLLFLMGVTIILLSASVGS